MGKHSTVLGTLELWKYTE